MKSKFRILLMMFIVVAHNFEISSECEEDERLSLLDIKSFFVSYKSTRLLHDNPFDSWVGADCCNWDRVKCNNLTSGAHVIELFLYDLLGWFRNYPLNVSVFQGLKQLKTLDLSYNSFSHFTSNQGFNKFSNFNNLETLNLSGNPFENEIFSSLSGLTSMKKLVLEENLLYGSISLLGLEHLTELYLDFNRLNQIQDMQGLENLRVLDVSDNNLNIFPLVQDLKNLRILDLSDNQLNSSLPIQGFCETNSLVELNLGNNQIRGELPECIGNFTKLKFVDISYNQFSGKIPTTISKLTSIEYLSFHENYFEGLFSFSILANHSKLRYFKIGKRNFGNIRVETEELPKWQPTFQLEILSLRSCNLNDQTASKIPSFLLSQNKLKYLKLANNHLVGPFPSWLLHNSSQLKYLDLSNNLLTGPLQLSTWNYKLRLLDISNNLCSGQLPTHLGLLLPKVVHFDISKNNFKGNLPSSMEQMKMLRWLDVSNNKFSGDLQMSMFKNMPLLSFLLLANNNFSGLIEDKWNNTSRLEALDISNNMLSGKIPSWVGNSIGLQYLQISKNRFVGELPIEICSLDGLAFLDVSQNQLVGEVPSTCFNSTSLAFLYMQNNGFSVPMQREIMFSLSNLKILDLSYNNISGHFPKWLNKCTSLQVLLLKGNELEGPIPRQLCQNGYIRIMDLSNNKLNGSIPSCFTNIIFGIINVDQTSTLNFDDDVHSIEDYEDFYVCDSLRLCFGPRFPPTQLEVDFTTKHRLENYKGNVINYMSGLDLSSNQLTGNIPQQIGDLVHIHSLNFSYNKLVGPIPKAFSNLKQLESLDLSNNLLSGNIPPELGTLNSLAIFNVSYNNLSGMIPTTPHFAYPESSFYGNPYLCGLYIEHKCSSLVLPTNNPSQKLEKEHGVFIDLEAFYWSFGVSYIIILLAFAAVLYINPQWHRRWFYFMEDCYYYCCKRT